MINLNNTWCEDEHELELGQFSINAEKCRPATEEEVLSLIAKGRE